MKWRDGRPGLRSLLNSSRAVERKEQVEDFSRPPSTSSANPLKPSATDPSQRRLPRVHVSKVVLSVASTAAERRSLKQRPPSSSRFNEIDKVKVEAIQWRSVGQSAPAAAGLRPIGLRAGRGLLRGRERRSVLRWRRKVFSGAYRGGQHTDTASL
ncbi:hypothetical protein MHYP_G00137840 [Metynnis hypsauchen]